MRIVCEFEDLVGQSVPLLEFFYNWYNFGLIKAFSAKKQCPSLTIDCEVVSILSANFPNSSVIINTPKKYEDYGRYLAENLTSDILNLKFVSVVNYARIEEADGYVSSSLLSMYKFSSVYDKVFVGDSIRAAIFSLTANGNRYVKDKLFYGIFTVSGSLFAVVYFVGAATIYMSFTPITSIMIDHFLYSHVFCVFFRVLIELLQVVNEYMEYMNGMQPRSSWPFVNCFSNVKLGFVYLFALFIACVYVLIYYPVGGFIALLTGMVYFLSYNMKFMLRMGAAFLSSGISWLLCKYVL
jgi:hypothetical protein